MRLLLGLLLPLCATIAVPVAARDPDARAIAVADAVSKRSVYQWVPGQPVGAERLAAARPSPAAVTTMTYGPFRVLDEHRVAMVGVSDKASPAAFAAMLRDHPRLAVLQMIDCPGTLDDIANLELGRMIRRAGLATHVPSGGSVRSGAVELFFAGTTRLIDDGAEFAVHSWEDDLGHEPTDFAADAPQNRKYVTYYREMGMDDAQARAFYAMTNSVPFNQALWLSAHQMRRWLPEARANTAHALAHLDAHLDSGAGLN